jgi:ATP-dependent protease Clp ATPase subunit
MFGQIPQDTRLQIRFAAVHINVQFSGQGLQLRLLLVLEGHCVRLSLSGKMKSKMSCDLSYFGDGCLI